MPAEQQAPLERPSIAGPNMAEDGNHMIPQVDLSIENQVDGQAVVD